jgi:hypothetical protein
MAKTKSVNSKQKQGEQIAKIVKRNLNKHVEVKYFDQYQISTNVTASGTITNISDITRGNDVTQRIGNQVTLKEIHFRQGLYLNANATQTAVRVLVVLDTFGTNAPSVSDVLETAFLSSVYSEIAPYYWDYRKRFRILHDDVTYLCKSSSASGVYKQWVNKLNLESQHIGSSTTFKNQIYLILVSNESNVLNLPVINIHSRLLFTDE